MQSPYVDIWEAELAAGRARADAAALTPTLEALRVAGERMGAAMGAAVNAAIADLQPAMQRLGELQRQRAASLEALAQRFGEQLTKRPA